MIESIDQTTATVAVARLTAVAVLLSCVEYLAQPRHLKSDGLLSWTVGSLREPWLTSGPTAMPLDAILRYPSVLALLGLRAAIAGVILIGPPSLAISPWVIGLAVVLSGLFILRNTYGQDGADQMAWILLTALALTGLVGTAAAQRVFLWFVTLQACFAYAVAGFAKASARGWRDGSYLIGICGTHIYGHAAIASALRQRPGLAKVMSCLLVTWECAFPLVLVAPLPVALAILGSGVLFHLINGYVMGLNTFIWSFTATYPAILFCVQARSW